MLSHVDEVDRKGRPEGAILGSAAVLSDETPCCPAARAPPYLLKTSAERDRLSSERRVIVICVEPLLARVVRAAGVEGQSSGGASGWSRERYASRARCRP